MYVAIDDVNYPTGGYLFPDTNKVITGGAQTIANTYQAQHDESDGQGGIIRTPVGPVPSYSLTGMSVPAAEVGIPATEKYVDHIRKVEMAEFMMWTGVTLDTSVEANRRLFISAPDKNGRQLPVNPSSIYIPMVKEAVGDPATWEPGADSPAYAIPPSAQDPSAFGSGNKVLHTPQIDFTRASQNWMMGRNLGTLKGKVVRTGAIKAYFPDPSITAGGGG